MSPEDEAFIKEYFTPAPEQLGGGTNNLDRARQLEAQQAIREILLRRQMRQGVQPVPMPQMPPGRIPPVQMPDPQYPRMLRPLVTM